MRFDLVTALEIRCPTTTEPTALGHSTAVNHIRLSFSRTARADAVFRPADSAADVAESEAQAGGDRLFVIPRRCIRPFLHEKFELRVRGQERVHPTAATGVDGH